MDALVGHSGFVGENLKAQHAFGALFNSSNIADIQGQHFQTLICSAVPATMWLANKDPTADKANIDALFNHLSKASADQVVLISTIAVYADVSRACDEDSNAFEVSLAYGKHRRAFEEMLVDAFDHVTILRLPALFGTGLKKNFIFDLLNPVPSFVKSDLFDRVLASAMSKDQSLMRAAFIWAAAPEMWAFDRTSYGTGPNERRIRQVFENFGFTAIGFTNPKSRFQFYNLANLWHDVQRALEYRLDVLNLTTTPLTASDIHRAVTGQTMPVNGAAVVLQDIRSRHSALWGCHDGYLYEASQTLADLRDFCGSADRTEPAI